MQEPTDFQKRVYLLLKKIPKGRITTYKIIGDMLGIKAYQAVGLACKMNPFAPEVPCHRVVKSDGSLGGYSASGGIKRKIALLADEYVYINKWKIIDFKKKLF